MPAKGKKKKDAAIFDSIRKPTAPPARKFGQEKPEEKAHPSQRKAKHKKKVGDVSSNGDIQSS